MPNINIVRNVILANARAAAAAPAFSALINFRKTSGYVTDGAGQTYCLSSDAYPTSRGGLTFGWESGAAADDEDRNNAIDARLAGMNYLGGTPGTFRLDLPSAKTYDARLATGDASFGQAAGAFEFIDTASSLYTMVNPGTLAAHWVDANAVDHNGSAAWVSGNTPKSLTFATTILRLTIQKTGGVGFAALSHLSVVG